VRSLNLQATRDPGFRSHFEHVLGLVEMQLRRRNSYDSHIGMPENGNPLYGLILPSEDDRLLEPYRAPDDVRDWFAARQNLFFRYLPKEKVITILEKHFGSGVNPPAAEQARLS
jgi:hypothetical protein